MAVTGYKGIDVRQSGDRLVFRAFWTDNTASNARVTTGSATIRLYELQNDGTVKSYDFNDNTFKTTALTTETLSLTHRTGNNSSTNTGLWSANLTTLTGFTRGANYLILAIHSTMGDQMREFVFGEAEGDFTVDR